MHPQIRAKSLRLARKHTRVLHCDRLPSHSPQPMVPHMLFQHQHQGRTVWVCSSLARTRQHQPKLQQSFAKPQQPCQNLSKNLSLGKTSVALQEQVNVSKDLSSLLQKPQQPCKNLSENLSLAKTSAALQGHVNASENLSPPSVPVLCRLSVVAASAAGL